MRQVVPGKPRWYQLKDATLSCRVKGCILLEMDVVFNNVSSFLITACTVKQQISIKILSTHYKPIS